MSLDTFFASSIVVIAAPDVPGAVVVGVPTPGLGLAIGDTLGSSDGLGIFVVPAGDGDGKTSALLVQPASRTSANAHSMVRIHFLFKVFASSRLLCAEGSCLIRTKPWKEILPIQNAKAPFLRI
jgi:hypothetical protein